MIYDDYLELAATYRAKYGAHAVVFMQVGDFYEIYGTEDADIRRVCDLCNLQLTRKNKALEASRKNPVMAGFPLYILQKHIQTMVAHGSTVVVIQQTTPPPNPKREVTGIYSPSTLLNPSAPESPYLMTMFWTGLGLGGTSGLAVGIACVDVSTGKTMVYETASQRDMPHLAEDEAVRWIAAFAPREIVVWGALPPADQRRVGQLIEGAAGSVTVHAAWDSVPPEYERPVYQDKLFALAYPEDAATAGLTGLTHYSLARTALAYLIQFAHEHNECLVQDLAAPVFLNPTRHLHLQTNSAQQLNVVGAAGEKSLLTLLNRCATAFGGRLFKDRLLHPIHDPVELERRWAAVDALGDAHADVLRHLANVNDLERMARRLALRQFAPMEWPALERSLEFAAKAMEAADGEGAAAAPLRAWLARVTATLDVGECAKYAFGDIHGNVFRSGVHADLDALAAALADHKARFDAIAAAWSSAGVGDATLCRVEVNDRDGWHIVTTKKRWETLMKKIKEASGVGASGDATPPAPAECTTRAVSATSANVRVSHPSLAALSDAILAAQHQIAGLATRLYKDFLATEAAPAAAELAAFVAPLAELDVHATHARNSRDYGYTRPRLADDGLRITGLRHPIIERVQQDVAYVPNDLALGGAAPTGWLLFGMNAAGKSSLMKSIGLAVMMAQAGMYVPAADMSFAPFHHIFTRISSGDNIYRGMSTFVVEMTELRNILQRCTDRSLVLGDELCAGTEQVSGVAIVGAGVEWLANKGATFVFATHLHELTDLPGIRALAPARLRVCHMHVDVANDGTIYYERSVKDGVGHRTYGLEVCRGLGLPPAFLAAAEATRRGLMGVPDRLLPPKTSRYSKKVLVHRCGVCGEPATETHHIVYQKDAGDNRPSNLVPLCEACHAKEHAGEIRIQGYRATSRGVKLVVD